MVHKYPSQLNGTFMVHKYPSQLNGTSMVHKYPSQCYGTKSFNKCICHTVISDVLDKTQYNYFQSYHINIVTLVLYINRLP